MSKASYFQRGETLDYTNSGSEAIEAGEVIVVGKRIGIAATLIKPGQIGTVDVVGVFHMPKATGAITMGAPVYWNAASGNITTTDTGNVPAGFAAAAAGSDDAEVLVKINA